MKPYVITFRRYNRNTIDAIRQCGLEPYIGQWGTRLCANVHVNEEDKERLTKELSAYGDTPVWLEVYWNQWE